VRYIQAIQQRVQHYTTSEEQGHHPKGAGMLSVSNMEGQRIRWAESRAANNNDNYYNSQTA
jgi:hypothetical protein